MNVSIYTDMYIYNKMSGGVAVVSFTATFSAQKDKRMLI